MSKTYRATAAGYVDDAYIVEGQIFTTDAPKGSWMEEVDEPAKDRKPARSNAAE